MAPGCAPFIPGNPAPSVTSRFVMPWVYSW